MKSKRVAIVQSSYIPWKGYFDLIRKVDEFILFDDMQFTKRDWRNRNRIKTPQGVAWLTIPVQVKGKFHQAIQDTQVSDSSWAQSHWDILHQAYRSSSYFSRYSDWLKDLYLGSSKETHLSRINYRFIDAICRELGIQTAIRWSTDYQGSDGKTKRLVSLCQQAGATCYLSGPSAKDYIEESLFTEAGIELEYMNYTGYPEYEQLYPPFDHAVTVLDLMLSVGPSAMEYIAGGSSAPLGRSAGVVT